MTDTIEGHINGNKARNCIVSALHFDFAFALKQCNISNPFPEFKEEITNFQVIINVLKNFKEIMQIASQPGTSVNENHI